MMQMYTPGPTNLHADVVNALSILPPYFASSDFGKVVGELQERIRGEFRLSNSSSGYVLIGTGSGTAGMEAAVRNVVDGEKSTFTISCGKYGENFHKMCLRAGARASYIFKGDHGYPPTEAEFLNLVGKLKPDVVFLTYTETTTGIQSPIHGYAKVLKRSFPNCLLVVDAVAITKLDFLDCSNFDIVIMASQKAIGGPPGLFFTYVDDRVEPVKSAPFYFDFNIERTRVDNNQTSHTPADRLYCATLAALKIKDEYLQRRLSFSQDVFKRWIQIPTRLASTAVVVLGVDGRAHEIQQRLKNRHSILIATGLREQAQDFIRLRMFGKDLDTHDFLSDMAIIQNVIREVHA